MGPRSGWYPDPAGRPRYRYWDGSQWTDRVTEESSTDAALRARAEQQERWVAQGDMRGVYGEFGAELMKSIEAQREPLGSKAQVARVAYTDAELQRLIERRPAMWRHAAFASVVVQRRIPLEKRLSEVRLGSKHPDSRKWKKDGHIESALDFEAEIDSQIRLAEGVLAFMSPERFVRSLNKDADPELIIETANLFMDYHQRYLELAESIRVYCDPDTIDIQRYVWGQLVKQLDKFDSFINDWLDALAAREEGLRYSSAIPVFAVRLSVVAKKSELRRCQSLIQQRHQQMVYRRFGLL